MTVMLKQDADFARQPRSCFARRLKVARALIVALWLSIVGSGAWAVSDFDWTFNVNGLSSSWSLTAVSSPLVFGGALPAANPDLNLILGKRYRVINEVFALHPFQTLAKGPTSFQDTVLLSQGLTVGALEADPDIAWTDDGVGNVEFTVTAGLLAAMRASGRSPGYRCGTHIDTMRGNFAIFGDGQPIADPIPARIPKSSIVVELDPLISGLVSPLGLTAASDGRLFVHDQVGRVIVIQNDRVTNSVFMDVSARLVALSPSFDERGLLGFALHPSFASNGRVYTCTSEPVGPAADFSTDPPLGAYNHQSVIAEWSVAAHNLNAIDPATRRELLRIDQPQPNHNAGCLQFGPDGFLYISLGDGGAGDDEGPGHSANGNGQDIANVYGSILRIDVAGGNSANGAYGVPPFNPFVGVAGVDEIFAYGLRNPYRFCFDPLTGALIVGDAGQNAIEEADLVTTGGNYGWRYKEGSFFFDPNGAGAGFVTTVPPLPVPPGLIDPIAQYDHNDGAVIVGGCVHRGAGGPGGPLWGKYIAGDFTSPANPSSGRMFVVDPTGGQFEELRIGPTDRPLGIFIKGFGQDRDGNVYVCGSQNGGPTGTTGAVLRIRPFSLSKSWTLF